MLKWGQEKPTQNGFYWFRSKKPQWLIDTYSLKDKDIWDVEIFKVSVDNQVKKEAIFGPPDRIYFYYHGESKNFQYWDRYHWCGPIPEPLEN